MKNFEKSYITEGTLPLVLTPKREGITFEEFLQEIRSQRDSLKKELLQHGGILFRGFPIDDVKAFNAVLDALGLGDAIDYIGGDSPRSKVEGEIYTSTEAPPSIKILLHNELSFVKNFPRHIYFYCDVEPESDGETIIGDARKIYQDVKEDVRQRFIDKQLYYTSRYYYKSKFMDFINSIQRGHKTWIDVFETEDKGEVERLCKVNDFKFRWLGNDWLEMGTLRPAITQHPETGETVWFNQAHLYDYNPKFLGWLRYIGVKLFYLPKDTLLHEVSFGDHTLVPKDDLYHVMDVLDKNTVKFPWKKGDVLVLDNVLAMHGRAPFKGKRRILTAMTS